MAPDLRRPASRAVSRACLLRLSHLVGGILSQRLERTKM